MAKELTAAKKSQLQAKDLTHVRMASVPADKQNPSSTKGADA
jgi:hypothetical protein